MCTTAQNRMRNEPIMSMTALPPFSSQENVSLGDPPTSGDRGLDCPSNERQELGPAALPRASRAPSCFHRCADGGGRERLARKLAGAQLGAEQTTRGQCPILGSLS